MNIIKKTLAAMLGVGSEMETVFTTYFKPEIETVAKIVITIATAATLVYFVITAISAGFKHRNNMEDEIPWRKLIIMFICLVVGTTASIWMWGVIGW